MYVYLQFEELRKRTASNSKWKACAKEKGISVNHFPIIPTPPSKHPRTSKQEAMHEAINGDHSEVVMGWNSEHNQPDSLKDPRLVFQKSDEDTKCTDRIDLKIPSNSVKKFISGESS